MKSSKIIEYQKKKANLNYPEIYQITYSEFPNQIQQEERLIIEDHKLHQYQEFSDIISHSEEENLMVWQKEIDFLKRIDPKLSKYITNWGLIYWISLHITLTFAILACFLRADFFNVRANKNISIQIKKF